MKHLNRNEDYRSPRTEIIDILMESVLCQSNQFGATLEEMEENDYTFKF